MASKSGGNRAGGRLGELHHFRIAERPPSLANGEVFRLFPFALAAFTPLALLAQADTAAPAFADAPAEAVPVPSTPAEWRAYLSELASGDPEPFQAALAEAEAAGMARGDLLLCQVVYHLHHGELPPLLTLAPAIEAEIDNVSYGEDEFFALKAQAWGLVHSLKAVRAFYQEDWATFEVEAREAYFTSPQWPRMLQVDQLVDQYQMQLEREAALANLQVPMSLEIRQPDGSSVSLASLAQGQKAILVDFWASWCGPCMRLMPELLKKQKALAPQGVYVAGLNCEDEDPLAKATQVKSEQGMDMPWLVEDEARTLSRLLQINSIPHMALIGPDGKLLWAGHPMDKGLNAALAKLGVTLE